MSEPSNPWQVVEEWLPGNDDSERPQMTLSTVSITGEPDARTVLLSEYDSRGFYFHTDALSRKVAAIAANPAVALTFLWPGFTKQLVVQGRAEVAPAEEITAAYGARSPFLQQLAWQNTFEFAQYPDDERRDRWAAFTAEHSDGGLPAGFRPAGDLDRLPRAPHPPDFLGQRFGRPEPPRRIPRQLGRLDGGLPSGVRPLSE